LCVATLACGGNGEAPNGAEAASGGAGTGNGVAGNQTVAGNRAIGGTGGSGSIGSSASSGGKFSASIPIDTTSTSTEVQCSQEQVPIEVVPPDIMIIMDRSMSMTDDVNGKICTGGSTSGNGNCGDASKWHQTVVAIEQVVNSTQKSVNWGLFWLGDEPTQCGASKDPIVPVTQGSSYDPIAQALDNNAFEGQIGTPTAAVVTNATAYMKALGDMNPKYLLVATDGEPNCANGRASSIDTTGATNAVAAAAKAGMPTFVVGIATTSVATASSALDSMAVAGERPSPVDSMALMMAIYWSRYLDFTGSLPSS